MTLQERYDEVEKTRHEYNHARQAVGVAHKAAVKLAAKKDATKIDDKPGVIHAEAVLIGIKPSSYACLYITRPIGRQPSAGQSGCIIHMHAIVCAAQLVYSLSGVCT